MIYQELLYSRSLSKDYRWMIIPSKVSPESLKALNKLYNLYDKDKGAFSKSSVSPLYCLNYPEMTFLVSCGLSKHKDKEGRDIYSLQGIGVPREHRRRFWFILPRMLANYDSKDFLNVWGKIDFSGADEVVRRASEDYFLKLDRQDESITKLTETPDSITEKLSLHEPAYLPFDRIGLNEMSRLITASNHTCIDFAFGATREMAKNFDFRVIAAAGVHSKRKNAVGAAGPERLTSLVVSDRERTFGKISEDPVDRFDSRKKGDISQAKTFKGNVASHILSQFLPRFKSLLHIGKKLKRLRDSGMRKD
ncbi:MAG: hypothetical protein HUU08_06390 [Candidatus Brocadia sp.]|nr:hypothetical protein [Candidatus Brocadia sp.]